MESASCAKRSFRSSIAPPTDASVYASGYTSRSRLQDSRPGWIRCFLSCRLFHPLQHAGLSRRSPKSPFFVPNRAGAGFGLVSPSCQLPWAKLAPALSTAPAEEGSQIGSIVGLWLVTFECDGAVWDVGFDQWHSDGT